MIGGWLGIAFAGSALEVEGSGVLAGCLADPACGAAAQERAADTLRSAALSAQGLGLGLSPAMVRGAGLGIELSAQSLALPRGAAPAGVDLAPGIPRLGIGAFGGRRTRYGGGIEGGSALPTDGLDLGFTVGARGGVAIGSPDERRWLGFEADGGYALVGGRLFDDPAAAAAELGRGGEPLPRCPLDPCVDLASLIHAGLDTVLAYDADSTAVLFLRFGGVFEVQTLDVGIDDTRWRWSGLLPRATFGGAYRPDPRAWIAAAVRLGILEASETPARSRIPWLGALSLGWRFGPMDRGPAVRAPAPVIVPAVAPVAAPVARVARADHPELDCGPSGVPTGAPPPLGLEGWCVTVSEDGRVIQEGPYVRWHTPEQIAERGEFTRDRRSGIWVTYDPQGIVLSHGRYVDGSKEGAWSTFYPNGHLHTEGRFAHGSETGEWVIWGEDGNSRVIGEYQSGLRSGLWRDYVGALRIRERIYQDGVMVSDEHYLPEE